MVICIVSTAVHLSLSNSSHVNLFHLRKPDLSPPTNLILSSPHPTFPLQCQVPISTPSSSRVFASAPDTASLPPSSPPPDAIVLHVQGMMCGGCTASVKRILENQPQVASASVHLETATAVVLATPEVKVTPNWQQQLGVTLANHLTTCGFESNLQG